MISPGFGPGSKPRTPPAMPRRRRLSSGADSLINETEDVAVIVGPEAGLGLWQVGRRIGGETRNLQGFGAFGEEYPETFEEGIAAVGEFYEGVAVRIFAKAFDDG